MPIFRALTALALLISTLTLPSPAGARTLEGRCTIDFFATSTLHDFSGTAACEPFTVEVGQDSDAAPRIEEAVVRVAVAGMETGRATRDRQMREMFDSERYPYITGVVRNADPDQIRQRLRTPGIFEFGLVIRDIAHRVTARAEEVSITERGLSFTLHFDVSLAAYELEPPTILGFIRVGDRVQVKVEVELSESATTEAAPS